MILLWYCQEWGGHQELREFSELYSVNIDTYDIITLSNFMHHISSGFKITKTIKLIYADGHYNSLIIRDIWVALQTCWRKY